MTAKTTCKKLQAPRPHGDGHPRSKITDAEVAHIVDLHAQGMGYGTLARKFEVSKTLIVLIVKAKRRIGARYG